MSQASMKSFLLFHYLFDFLCTGLWHMDLLPGPTLTLLLKLLREENSCEKWNGKGNHACKTVAL